MSMSRRRDRRPTVSTRCQESARGAIAYHLKRIFLLPKKKTPITGYLETFIVMVSFFLSPQPSLLAPEKPAREVQIVETAQRKASRKKSVGGRERWGKKPSSLPLPFFRFFSPAFFCATIHCLNS